MGYNTEFYGSVTVDPPLNAAEVEYLKEFNRKDHRGADVPGYYCQWVPADDGTAIEWDYNEKFYDATAWMEFIIDQYLRPGAWAEGEPGLEGFTFDHTVNGVIRAFGEGQGDVWRLVVKDNVVSEQRPQKIIWTDGTETDSL